MILLVGVVAALATVPLLGGSFRGLDRLHLRGAPWIAASFGAQVLLVDEPDGWMPRIVFTVSIALAGVFVWSNRHQPGARLLAWGGGLNLAAVASNGGVMPAWTWAWAVSGAPALDPTGYANARPSADAWLLPLGDVIPFPPLLPGSAPFSIGDVLLIAGFAVIVHRACGVRWALGRLRVAESTLSRRGLRARPDPRTPSPG